MTDTDDLIRERLGLDADAELTAEDVQGLYGPVPVSEADVLEAADALAAPEPYPREYREEFGARV